MIRFKSKYKKNTNIITRDDLIRHNLTFLPAKDLTDFYYGAFKKVARIHKDNEENFRDIIEVIYENAYTRGYNDGCMDNSIVKI